MGVYREVHCGSIAAVEARDFSCSRKGAGVRLGGAALRVAACSRAGSSIARVFVGSFRLLHAASDMRRRRLVKRGTIEMGAGQGRKHAKQKALVGVLAEIPVDGVGNSGRLSGARVRCVVPGNVERVVELCVGAGDFVQRK